MDVENMLKHMTVLCQDYFRVSDSAIANSSRRTPPRNMGAIFLKKKKAPAATYPQLKGFHIYGGHFPTPLIPKRHGSTTFHNKVKNDTSVDPKQQYISRLSKTCVYKAGHGVSSCSLWSMPSEHGASSWGIIMGHLYRFMGHHHLEHEHAQANAACNNATSNCSSERPSHVVFHVHVIGTLLWTLHWSYMIV